MSGTRVRDRGLRSQWESGVVRGGPGTGRGMDPRGMGRKNHLQWLGVYWCTRSSIGGGLGGQAGGGTFDSFQYV